MSGTTIITRTTMITMGYHVPLLWNSITAATTMKTTTTIMTAIIVSIQILDPGWQMSAGWELVVVALLALISRQGSSLSSWLERWEGTKGVQINKDGILTQKLVFYSARLALVFTVCCWCVSSIFFILVWLLCSLYLSRVIFVILQCVHLEFIYRLKTLKHLWLEDITVL